LNCELAITTVHGYFDGEMDALRAAEFERHLETCAECKAELEKIQSLRRRFQETDLFQKASPQLYDRIRKQIAHEAKGTRQRFLSFRPGFLLPAFGALAAVVVLGIVFFGFQSQSRSARLTAELLDAHVRSLQPGHLADVQSTDQHTVKPWFDGKLDFIPPVADFSAQGFPLVGGRLDIVDGHNVAALVYSRRKHFINVFVWPYRGKETNLVDSGSRQGYNWLAWKSNDMQFYVVSDTSPADLRELRDLISR
jgi:anti-sigma factor RsiW